MIDKLPVPEGNYLDAKKWFGGMVRAIIRPLPRTRLWKWLDQWVVIPEASGGPNTGRLRTGRFPIFRGLFDLCQQRGVHFLTLCSSARAGKTLFCICLVLYWIAEKIGWIGWLDPTRNSARKFVRDELDDFLLECAPVRKLAIISKKTWTTLEKSFRGKRMRIIGSGAEADMHGFNLELLIENELDACRSSTEADAASSDKMEARTKLFAPSRLIVRNSTPQKGESGPIWHKFRKGTQHHCYVPCPHCSNARAHVNKFIVFEPSADDDVRPGWSPLSYDPRLAGWQRFTFFSETATVPFDDELNELRDADGNLLPRSQWREEVTGQAYFERFAIYEDRPRADDPTKTERVRVGWNIRGVRRGATYQCAHCKKEIEQIDRDWMLARYRWMPHNPDAELGRDGSLLPSDEDDEEPAGRADSDEHISAHVWSWYSPFEYWGAIAAEFLQAKGNLAALIKFTVYTLGRPFVRLGAAIKEDDLDRVINRCPKPYVQGQMPFEAEILTVAIDRQGDQLWWGIRAWGILWDHPEWATWSALIDWGEAVSGKQILELCGLLPDATGNVRKFKFTLPDGSVREYCVTTGLYDSGFETNSVYEFCLATGNVLSPSKGGDQTKTRGAPVRIAQVMDDQVDLVWFWSDFFADNLYYSCIKDGADLTGPIYWWLPTNIDKHYRQQLTDEYKGEDASGKRSWMSRTKTNHLGDVEKQQRVMSDDIETHLDAMRELRREKEKPPAD